MLDDATVHKHLQIQEGKQRLEDILASLKDAFIALDPQQRYTYVNSNAAQMLGARKQGTRHWRRQDALLHFATLSRPLGHVGHLTPPIKHQSTDNSDDRTKRVATHDRRGGRHHITQPREGDAGGS
jgi:PAS domain-containing protein